MKFFLPFLLFFLPFTAFAQSSANYQIVNPSNAPAVGQSSGAQYQIQGALATMAGAVSSTSYSVYTGPPLAGSQSNGSSSSAGGGGVIIPSSNPVGSSTSATTALPLNVQVVDVTQDSAILYFETTQSVRGALQYKQQGRFDPVQLPFPLTYSKTHAFTLYDLKPNTSYVFVLFIEQQNGGHAAFGNDTYIFTTAKAQTTPAPLPVTRTPPWATPQKPIGPYVPQTVDNAARNFSAIAAKGEVLLTWDEPIGLYARIDIYRSETSFTAVPGAETKVFSGKGTRTTDFSPAPGKNYYYTLFVYDEEGNIISKNVARTEVAEEVITPEEPNITVPNQGATEQSRTYVPTEETSYILYGVILLSLLFILFLIFFVVRKITRQEKNPE